MQFVTIQLHLKEATALALLRDPLLPSDPTLADVRAAIARMDEKAKEGANQ